MILLSCFWVPIVLLSCCWALVEKLDLTTATHAVLWNFMFSSSFCICLLYNFMKKEYAKNTHYCAIALVAWSLT